MKEIYLMTVEAEICEDGSDGSFCIYFSIPYKIFADKEFAENFVENFEIHSHYDELIALALAHTDCVSAEEIKSFGCCMIESMKIY